MPTAVTWRRIKARRRAAKLASELRQATCAERVEVLEQIADHMGELLHAYCTEHQLQELYKMGLSNPDQAELFPEP